MPMGKSYFTCKRGCRVEYDTGQKTRPKYCHSRMVRMVDLLVSADAGVEAFRSLFAAVIQTAESRQVRL